MKKILNDPFKYVDEMLEGMCLAHPDLYRQKGESGRVITRASDMGEGKVGIVSGGGKINDFASAYLFILLFVYLNV